MTNQVKTVLLLGAMAAALVGVGFVLGGPWPYVLGVAAMAGSWFFSDRLVLTGLGNPQAQGRQG